MTDPASGITDADGNNPSSSSLYKAIEVLGPRVPANGAGIVIIVVVAGAVLTVVGARKESTTTIIVACVIVALALIYAFVILLPQWMMQKQKGRYSADIPTKSSHADTIDPKTVSETSVATTSLAGLLTNEQHDAVCAAVVGATKEAASMVGVDLSLVRGNIFGSDGNGFLKIMPQFDHNMLFTKERTTKMRINEGSTGHAWHRCRPNIAVRPRERGAFDSLSAEQTARLAPDLQWIISIPVFVEEGNLTPTWILNVDGLEEPRTAEELEPAVGALLRWAEQLSRILRNVADGS